MSSSPQSSQTFPLVTLYKRPQKFPRSVNSCPELSTTRLYEFNSVSSCCTDTMRESILVRSMDTSCEGLRDQYADGKAALVWETYIGSIHSRTQNYNKFLTDLLRMKKCNRILDVACGTGVDSVMLLEQGFEVVSTDASDKMLKYALKKRWSRRNEEAFSNWVIEEANWVTLVDDIREHIKDGFDAVICLGNSFAHLIDTTEERTKQKKALQNFQRCIRPGGLLFIDHRNFDLILEKGQAPAQSIYYNNPFKTEIQTSVLHVAGKPTLVIMDYTVDVKLEPKERSRHRERLQLADYSNGESSKMSSEFRLSYHPHKLDDFTQMLEEAFPKPSKHTVYGDFKPLSEIEHPGYFIHVMEKFK